MDETVEIKTEREREATGPYPTTPPLFTACSAEEVRRRNLPLLGDTLPSSLSSSPSYFTRRLRDRPPPRSRSWRRPENPSPLRTRGREKGRRERVHRFDVIPLWEKKRKEGSYRNQAARVSYTRLILRRGRTKRVCTCAFTLSLSLSRRRATLIIRLRGERGSMLGQHIKIMASIGGRWFVYTQSAVRGCA